MECDIRETENGVVLPVRVQPKASRDKVVGLLGGRLKVAVTAPARGGRANAALVKLIAKAFGLRTSCVSIVSGQTSRDKQVLLENCTKNEIEKALADLA